MFKEISYLFSLTHLPILIGFMAFIIANVIIAMKRFKKQNNVNIGLPQPDEEQPQPNGYNNEAKNPSMISQKGKQKQK